jgi:hypothetical protein
VDSYCLSEWTFLKEIYMSIATEEAADPNTITDPTIPNFDILATFQEFGYQPTQAEISSLSQSFAGSTDPGIIGTNAIAQYVNYMDQINKFNASDPLTGLQTQMNNIITQNQASVMGLNTQLQDVLSSAPKLFGNLTPDQISTYLAPLQTSFNTQMSQVQATLATRGLGASSTEANALAQTNQQFQETVLSTGLNIGLTSQQNQAQALEAQISNLFGQTNTAMNITGQAAGQQSSQQLGESQLIGSLPSILNSQSAQEEKSAQAQYNAQHPGFQGMFNEVTGDINTSVSTLGNLATGGKNISGPFGIGVSQSQPSAPAPSATAGNAGSTLMPGGNSSPLSLGYNTTPTASGTPNPFAAVGSGQQTLFE